MKQIVIFGTTSFAQQAYAYLSHDSMYKIAAFTVHEKYLHEKKMFGLEVVPFEIIEETHPPDQFEMYVAIGFKKVNQARAEIYTQCKKKGYNFISYFSSKAACWGHVEIGDNTFIRGNAVIEPFVKIGNNVVIGSSQVGHNSIIGDHCWISGQALIAGNVKVGDYSFVGANSTIRDGVVIAPECVIGAGALILKDTEKGGVYPGQETKIGPIPSSELKYFK